MKNNSKVKKHKSNIILGTNRPEKYLDLINLIINALILTVNLTMALNVKREVALYLIDI